MCSTFHHSSGSSAIHQRCRNSMNRVYGSSSSRTLPRDGLTPRISCKQPNLTSISFLAYTSSSSFLQPILPSHGGEPLYIIISTTPLATRNREMRVAGTFTSIYRREEPLLIPGNRTIYCITLALQELSRENDRSITHPAEKEKR